MPKTLSFCFFGLISLAVAHAAIPQIRENLLADTLIKTAAAAVKLDTTTVPEDPTPPEEQEEGVFPLIPLLTLPKVDTLYAGPIPPPLLSQEKIPPEEEEEETFKEIEDKLDKLAPKQEFHAKNMICDFHHTDGVGSKILCYQLDVENLKFSPQECTPGPHGGIICEKQLFGGGA